MNQPETQHYYTQWTGKCELVTEFTTETGYEMAVINGKNGLEVVSKKDLGKYEDSYEYKQEQERVAKLKKMVDFEEKIINRIKVKAIQQMEARIRLNVAFGDKSVNAVVGITIAEELAKIINEMKDYEIKKLAEEDK